MNPIEFAMECRARGPRGMLHARDYHQNGGSMENWRAFVFPVLAELRACIGISNDRWGGVLAGYDRIKDTDAFWDRVIYRIQQEQL